MRKQTEVCLFPRRVKRRVHPSFLLRARVHSLGCDPDACFCMGPVCFVRAGRRPGGFFPSSGQRCAMLLSVSLRSQKRLGWGQHHGVCVLPSELPHSLGLLCLLAAWALACPRA